VQQKWHRFARKGMLNKDLERDAKKLIALGGAEFAPAQKSSPACIARRHMVRIGEP